MCEELKEEYFRLLDERAWLRVLREKLFKARQKGGKPLVETSTWADINFDNVCVKLRTISLADQTLEGYEESCLIKVA